MARRTVARSLAMVVAAAWALAASFIVISAAVIGDAVVRNTLLALGLASVGASLALVLARPASRGRRVATALLVADLACAVVVLGAGAYRVFAEGYAVFG